MVCPTDNIPNAYSSMNDKMESVLLEHPPRTRLDGYQSMEFGNPPAGVTEITEFISGQDSAQGLHFPILLKVMTDDETKEYHLQKFAEWAKKWEEQRKLELVFGVDSNVYRNGELLAEEPNKEEKKWVIHKMKAPQRAMERWFVGQYFPEEQKRVVRIS